MMLVIDWQRFKKKALKKFKSDGALEEALDAWYTAISSFTGTKPNDLKKCFSYVDVVPPQTVFNIRGNNYRLIAELDYQCGICVPTHFLRHPEYDKKKWKK